MNTTLISYNLADKLKVNIKRKGKKFSLSTLYF